MKSYHDSLSSGLLVINDNYEILLHNKKMEELGPLFFDAAHLTSEKCHEWIYNEAEPCGNCPLKQNPDFTGKHTKSIVHNNQQVFMTENFQRTNNQIVLTVSNTTRVIELTKMIKVQQHEMQSMNSTLRDVLEFGAQLQDLDSEEVIFKLTLNHLQKIFFFSQKMPSGFLLLHPSNRNTEHAAFHLMTKDQEQELFSDYLKNGTKSFSSNGFNLMIISGGEHTGNIYFFYRADPFEEKRENIVKILLNMISSLLERTALMRNIEKRAYVDGLTGAFNRAYFQQCFEAEKKKVAHINLPFCLIVIDINGLKEVNDVFGHEGGDQLIMSCGQLLLTLVRVEDIVARYGGDEYVVLLPATGAEGLEAVLNRLQEKQHSASFILKNKSGEDVSWPMRFSFGSAASDQDNVENIFQIADQRMYDDKEKYYQTHKRYR